MYTSDTQTVTYYYEAINPDTVVDGIKNNGVYCKNAKFKVTSPDYTQVMAGNKILTPDADGAYTVSAAVTTSPHSHITGVVQSPSSVPLCIVFVVVTVQPSFSHTFQ